VVWGREDLTVNLPCQSDTCTQCHNDKRSGFAPSTVLEFPNGMGAGIIVNSDGFAKAFFNCSSQVAGFQKGDDTAGGQNSS
jgi:hypothetical protein